MYTSIRCWYDHLKRLRDIMLLRWYEVRLSERLTLFLVVIKWNEKEFPYILIIMIRVVIFHCSHASDGGNSFRRKTSKRKSSKISFERGERAGFIHLHCPCSTLILNTYPIKLHPLPSKNNTPLIIP